MLLWYIIDSASENYTLLNFWHSMQHRVSVLHYIWSYPNNTRSKLSCAYIVHWHVKVRLQTEELILLVLSSSTHLYFKFWCSVCAWRSWLVHILEYYSRLIGSKFFMHSIRFHVTLYCSLQNVFARRICKSTTLLWPCKIHHKLCPVGVHGAGTVVGRTTMYVPDTNTREND